MADMSFDDAKEVLISIRKNPSGKVEYVAEDGGIRLKLDDSGIVMYKNPVNSYQYEWGFECLGKA